MRFDKPRHQTALEEWRASVNAEEHVCADNIWFEERVSPTRKVAFEDLAQGVMSAETLKKAQVDYWKQFVVVDGEVPHTFLQKLDPASLDPIDEGQSIVRLEGLDRAINASRIPFDSLQKALSNKNDPQERALIDKFLETWNISRDWRPAFAAFHDELQEDIEKNDWANRLRDRLGLAHFSNPPIPVALMKYTAMEVYEALDLTLGRCSFTAPTVFDGPPSPHFFPAPANLNAGRTMALFEIADDSDLLCELLHFRISYKCDHLFKLGQITELPPNCPLNSLRNNHLTALLFASKRSDFGEEIF